MNEIYGKEYLSEISGELISYCLSISHSIFACQHHIRLGKLALDYIEKNYKDPKLSLDTVCEYLSISSSYFCVVFKNYTGKTFIEVLTSKRIEKAKSLLENTSKKIYQIADEVGYKDPNYFNNIFKKTTGMTPGEYSRKMRR